MRLIMLGSGTSSGVPRIGGDWGRCDPKNPKNRRSRVSVLVEHEDIRLLVDTGPDLRNQLIDNNINWLSAVLYTHDHADHTHGIDDLRALYHAQQSEIPCYMDQATKSGLRTRFSYVFSGRAGYPATATAHLIQDEMRFGSLTVRPFKQQHGPIHSYGYRFEADGCAIAYSTDLNAMPEAAWPLVQNLDLWIVDALRREPHPTHSHLAQTLAWIEQCGAKQAWLTHMDQSMDVAELMEELPAHVSPGWDGRIWEFGR